MSTIAIIGAMDEEVANIASALSDITVTEEAGVSVTRGTIETNKGTRVNVAATVGGMGTGQYRRHHAASHRRGPA